MSSAFDVVTRRRGTCGGLDIRAARRDDEAMGSLDALIRAYAMGAALLASGCGSLPGTARTMFSTSRYCPRERVTATERPDVAPHTLMERSDEASPPPDIAGDPDRLQMWQRAHDSHTAEIDRKYTVYEIEGCGQREQYACYMFVGDDSGPECTTAIMGLSESAPPLPLPPPPLPPLH